MVISLTVGFEESQDDSRFQSSEENDFKISHARSNTFLRGISSNDNDVSQDDDSINEEQRFIRRDQTNSTYYKDRNGRICVLCKWGIAPCCSPNLCKKHHIRFNECVEIKGR